MDMKKTTNMNLTFHFRIYDFVKNIVDYLFENSL